MRLNLSVLILMLAIFCGISLKVLFSTASYIQDEVATSFQLTNQLIDTKLKYIRSHSSNAAISSELQLDLFNPKEFDEIKYIDVELFDSNGKLISSNYSKQSRRQLWLPERIEYLLIFGLFDQIDSVTRSIDIDQKRQGKITISVDRRMKLHNLWSKALTSLIPMLVLLVISYLIITIVISYVIKPLVDFLRLVNQENISTVLSTSLKSNFGYLGGLPKRLQGIRNELKNSSQQVHDLNDRILHLQEDERRMLSAELHDELGQHLTAISFEAEVIKTATSIEDTKHSAEAIDEISRNMRDIVRSILRRLRPPELDIFGLQASITEMVADWGHHHPKAEIDFKCEADFSTLNQAEQLNIYRIVQEGLTNISRHAGSKNLNITIYLLSSDSQITITIKDDGLGCDLTKNTQGFGLNGMRERVNNCSGTISIDSGPNQGMNIKIVIPSKSESEDE